MNLILVLYGETITIDVTGMDHAKLQKELEANTLGMGTTLKIAGWNLTSLHINGWRFEKKPAQSQPNLQT